jgi:hypothetical protein
MVHFRLSVRKHHQIGFPNFPLSSPAVNSVVWLQVWYLGHGDLESPITDFLILIQIFLNCCTGFKFLASIQIRSERLPHRLQIPDEGLESALGEFMLLFLGLSLGLLSLTLDHFVLTLVVELVDARVGRDYRFMIVGFRG